MNYAVSITKKYLTMQYLKTKRAVVALTALPHHIREPIQAGDRIILMLAWRSQVCNNGHIKNNSLSFFLAVNREGVLTPTLVKTDRSTQLILAEDTIKRYRANQGYVYLIHAVGTDRYKIGRSVNPVARLETLKGQSPYPLQIIECFWTPDAIADEAEIHKRLAHLRKYGEWFEFSSITPEQKESLGKQEASEEDWELFGNSRDYIIFESFHADKPTHKALSKLINDAFVDSVKQRNDVTKIARIILWEYFEVKVEIYFALSECSSLTQMQKIIDFIFTHWIDSVLYSLRSLEGVTYREVTTAFQASLQGFVCSLLMSKEV